MAAHRDFEAVRDLTILSQYSASPRILDLARGFALRIDPSPDIDAFFDNVFNIETARGWGLDNWGRILGIPRGVQVATVDWFGYYGSQLQPWNNAPWYNDKQSTNNFPLTDEAYRQLLMYKAGANIGDASAATINRLLSQIFPTYDHVVDNLDMSIRAVFSDYLQPVEIGILNSYGALNKGAGVQWVYLSVNPDEVFGFDNSGFQPFDCGVFTPYDVVIL
jgi:hypothetical protein